MKSFRERSPVLVGIISIVLLSIGVGFAFSLNKFEGLRGVYSISADLRDAAGVHPGNEVRVAGVRVGQVTQVELTPEAARIKMEIQDYIELPQNTRLEVKLKTLLGQKFVDLQMPRSVLAARSGDPSTPLAGSGGMLEPGDVIPMSHTKIPFDIYQAANQGTEVLAEIDKDALRDLLDVLAGTFERSGPELRRALVGLSDLGDVLGPKSAQIGRLLRNLNKVSGTLALSGTDLEGILDNSAEVLGVLADRRETISTLLAATNDLGRNLGTLVQVARGSIELGVTDLNSLLIAAESELATLERALEELPVSQKLFAQAGQFGRFIEGNACAVTSEDTCVPDGTPEDPGLPVHGTQPSPGANLKVLP
jgi:phospholipid/cholesterol/gamma-HCH transport system substrate-binding protein